MSDQIKLDYVPENAFAYYNMKITGTGATFSSMPGAQRVLETSLFTGTKSTT
jgi:hypothetical protein